MIHTNVSRISIHVPSWGTTRGHELFVISQGISIHVPSWGTTNKTFPVSQVHSISIHVPSWGTTDGACCTLCALKFQSTFPRGERPSLETTVSILTEFQSTFPRGERPPDSPASPKHPFNFNPRSLVGNDEAYRQQLELQKISIHVPSWGTTRCPVQLLCDQCISIHVPSWGTTFLLFLWTHFILYISIHVPSWGTTMVGFRPQYKKVFQSTFPRGERQDLASSSGFSPNFNPRSLVGNDGKFSQIFFVFLCNKYNFSTFYYPFSLFFSVIHVTFLIFVVRILPAFYVYF